jgi:hypothetical protein
MMAGQDSGMFRWLLICALACASRGAGLAQSLPTAERVADCAEALTLLGKHCIVVSATGTVAVGYAGLARAFRSPDLLGSVQREYARQLPECESPEFTIQQRAPGDYYYVNREQHASFIREIHRAEHEGPVTELVLLARGRRFFGDFEALIHIGVAPLDDRLRYEAKVYAYPEAHLMRFLARHLGLVERYFRRKTRDIEALSTRIGVSLCGPAT